jgi:uncharacterized protein (TIGR00369 family)
VDDETQPEQASPEVLARIQASFERQGFMRHLGARLEHVAPGRVRIVLPGRPEVTQQHGYFHAGATSAIADSAGGYAALTLFPANTEVLTVEYKINLLSPASGDHLEAVGMVRKAGRTLSVCQLEVYDVQSGQRSLIATGQQTLIRVNASPGRSEAAPTEEKPPSPTPGSAGGRLGGPPGRILRAPARKILPACSTSLP